jgi:Kdo2-lipid IVA lauroyltransferase/acyltransferase
MSDFRYLKERLKVRLKRPADWVIGPLAVGLFKGVRRLDPDRTSDRAGRWMRRLGPLLAEHRVGRANLSAAFPEKSAGEIEQILLGVWENLGRSSVEFAHLDRLWDYHRSEPNSGRIEFAPGTHERFLQMGNDGKPALIFAAHLANWELPQVALVDSGMKTAALYRAPNVGQVATLIKTIRANNIGTLIPTDRNAPFRVAAALQDGTHVAMLVDQHFGQGVDVDFFGRPCKANPFLARVARNVDCPIYGARVVRLPDHRFRFEFTGPIEPRRERDGRVAIQPTMQMITTIVEGWVREHPEQWLWLHRRWR